jgi:hypothetical protein
MKKETKIDEKQMKPKQWPLIQAVSYILTVSNLLASRFPVEIETFVLSQYLRNNNNNN